MNVHDAVAFVEEYGPEMISVIERIKSVESVVAALLPAPVGAAIETGTTIAEDVIEGVDDLAARIDAMFGQGTAAKLQQPAKPATVSVGDKSQTVTIGSKSGLQLQLYDKTREPAPAAKPAPAPAAKPAPAASGSSAIDRIAKAAAALVS